MQKQINELNFEGKNIYVGLDVHLKSWSATGHTEHLHHKTFTQPEYVGVLVKYLHRNFSCDNYYSVYEAGVSVFWTHYKLKKMGVDKIVINPAEVPTTQTEHLRKDYPTDSRKLFRSLRSKTANKKKIGSYFEYITKYT